LAAQWDVVVLDLHLPDVLGITVLSELRRRGFRAPILVMTGWYLDGGHHRAASALGAVAFVRKPVAADELGTILRSVVRGDPALTPENSAALLPPRAFVEERGHAHWAREENAGLRVLYERAAAGEQVALDRLCEQLLPLLERAVGMTNNRLPREWAHDAVQDALMEFRANVQRFDPARGVPLLSFLKTAARRNLLNRIDAERRRGVHEVSNNAGGIESNDSGVAPDYERSIDFRRAVTRVWAGLTHVERRVFRLVLQGEHNIEAFARAADLVHLAVPEQRRMTKRITNRIFQRMRRLREAGGKQPT
jgi:CheY-like chemotaxis protein